MSAPINDGGPAFPWQLTVTHGSYNPLTGKKAEGNDVHVFTGMTLRDYFAAKAMAVMCASNVNLTGTFATPDGRAAVAAACYYMADAMLAEREKGKQP